MPEEKKLPQGYIPVREYAARTGQPVDRVLFRIASGGISAVKCGRVWYIPDEACREEDEKAVRGDRTVLPK